MGERLEVRDCVTYGYLGLTIVARTAAPETETLARRGTVWCSLERSGGRCFSAQRCAAAAKPLLVHSTWEEGSRSAFVLASPAEVTPSPRDKRARFAALVFGIWVCAWCACDVFFLFCCLYEGIMMRGVMRIMLLNGRKLWLKV